MNVKSKNFKRVLAGGLTGAVNGLFGGGGGMVAVPILKNMLGYKEKGAHATAILVIAPVCLVSAITYIVNGYFIPGIVIPAAIGSTAGGMIGALMLEKLPTGIVNAIFIAVMLVAGVRMLF
ncbi:MAG: sulfite exporter TauE/SafE family protein [Clostridiales bacterium]|nr:sulfite exporter TauE/SafE family protein [Clostridiales bacterium]